MLALCVCVCAHTAVFARHQQLLILPHTQLALLHSPPVAVTLFCRPSSYPTPCKKEPEMGPSAYGTHVAISERIENAEMNPQLYDQLIFYKSGKSIQWENF